MTTAPARGSESGHAAASPVRRLSARLRRSRPTRRQLLLGALLWGLLMAAAAGCGLYLRHNLETAHLRTLLLLYFFGGLFAWLIVLPLARLLAFERAPEARFAAFFLVLTCGTIAMTAFLFAMEYRLFYARWHQPFGTRIWLLQFSFTSASAVYQFIVLGIRLYLPLGFLFLVGASLFLARRMR